MALLGIRLKDPDDTLDYDVDFSRYLPEGDAIQTASASADAGLTIDSTSVADQVVKVWISAGSDGATYAVTVTAASVGGRVKDATFKLRVRHC